MRFWYAAQKLAFSFVLPIYIDFIITRFADIFLFCDNVYDTY